MNRPELIRLITKEAGLSVSKENKTAHYLNKRQMEQLLLTLRSYKDTIKELKDTKVKKINNELAS